MKIMNQDILKVKQGIICHQVNCKGKVGAGIALKIRKKWPEAYNDYMRAYASDYLQLGNVVFSTVVRELVIAHCCGQFNYGRNGLYTNYEALRKCLEKVRDFSEKNLLQVYIPHKMSCSLAGGDWEIVSRIISETIPNTTICKL